MSEYVHDQTVVCDTCGQTYGIGQSPYCKDGHGFVQTHHPFIPYFDFALGEQVDSLARRKRLMRDKHLDYRDKPRPGDLSARRDRIEETKKERARA